MYAEQENYIFRGTIYDNDTKLPVQNVNVYLDGTRIGTTTDTSGKFELTVSDIIYTSLVFSHVSYKQFIIYNPYSEPSDTIFMTPKEYELNSVNIVVRKDPFSRAQKMKVFKKQFLGTGKAGKSCTIENEDDIHLFYNMGTRTLSASSEKPLFIKNKYLDYDLSFELLTFDVIFLENKMKNESVKALDFYGTAFFSDNHPADEKIKKRREEMYRKSDLYFFKNFVNNTLKESKFVIFSKGKKINPLDYFTIQDTLSMKKVSFKIEESKVPLAHYEDVIGSIGVVYNKKLRTNLMFKTDTFIVDAFGYTNLVGKIVFSGVMGNQRVGNMLPIDYLPDE
jgi:hypothetical protein